ncbi:hypothetical protein AB205_0045850, partial [Aquarana catesbeiana]
EVLDSEIAQEIQEKLVIEAESRRRQEEKDEDIARLLQEREEKRRKKHNPPHGTEEAYYPDHGGHHRGRPKEHMSEFDRHHRNERPERRKEESHPKSKQRSHCDDDRKRGRSAEPRSGQGENPDLHKFENHMNRTSDKKEKPDRPPPPRTNRHEQPEDKELSGAYSSENVPRKGRSQSHDLLSTNNADVQRRRHSPSSPSDRRGTESANERGKPRRRVATGSEYEHERPRRRAESEYEHERHGKGAEGENEHEGHRRRAESKSAHEKHRRRTPSPNHERQPSDGGNRPKGHRDGPQGKLHIGGRIRDEDDAEIARRLQEEELRVNTVDYKTAQLAQDEEIARWLMEKEEKSYKKSKGREKERRRADEQELNTPERVRLRSKDEHHRSRSDKPYSRQNAYTHQLPERAVTLGGRQGNCTRAAIPGPSQREQLRRGLEPATADARQLRTRCYPGTRAQPMSVAERELEPAT